MTHVIPTRQKNTASVSTGESLCGGLRASPRSCHSLPSDAGCPPNEPKLTREEEQQQSGCLLFSNRRCGSGAQLARRPAALTTDDPGDLCSATTHRRLTIMGPTGPRGQPLMESLSIFFDFFSTSLWWLVLGLATKLVLCLKIKARHCVSRPRQWLLCFRALPF